MPPLQQTDFQLQNAQVFASSDDEPSSTTRRPPRAKTLLNGHEPSSGVGPKAATARHNQTGHLVPPNPSARSRQDGKHNHHHHHQNHPNKHEDSHRLHESDHRKLPFGGSTSASHDNYDALSTEPTPSQVRSELPADSLQKAARQAANGGRHNANRQHKDNIPQADTNTDPLDEPVDLVDDIHTTRSSLATKPSSYPDNNNDGTNTTAGPFDQSAMSITPSLAMHGPYGITSPPLNLNTHQFNSNAQLQALLAQHASNNKLEPPMLEQDDMMTSYSRMPSAGNISEAIMRDYNLATALGGSGNSSGPAVVNSFFSGGESGSPTDGGVAQVSANTPPRHRLHSAALPFSVLLSDLIKLTRPAAMTQQPPAGSSAAFEQPANSRPQQQSILQQLRSLPGPLLALLQGSAAGGPSGAVHELGSASHDASESSPHYQRISMSPTEMHSILSRSLRSTGVLPAFPAPKDAPENWIPPTAGGSPTVHDAMNSNADFVASNAAGFVRAPGQHPQASSNNGHQTNADQSHYQPSQESTNQQPDVGSSRQLQQQQVPNQSQGHFISIEQHQAQRQAQQQAFAQQQQQQPQQHPALISNQQQLTQDNNRQDYQLQPQQQAAQVALGAQVRGSMQGQLMNQRPMYNSRPVSEIPVPLGYNPAASIQQQQPAFAHANQHKPLRRALEFALPAESAPKASITSSVVSSVISNQNQPQPGKQVHQQQQQQPTAVNGAQKRVKREIEMAASRDNPSEEEEFLDSRPVSIVRPDGRPMSGNIQLNAKGSVTNSKSRQGYTNLEHQSGRAGEADLPSPSLRQVNHMDFDALSRYASAYNRRQSKFKPKTNQVARNKKLRRKNKKLIGVSKGKFNTASDSKSHTNLALDAAGSGLMSKLLGTASNVDDVEEDVDGDDEESANERRKEELDDAEFGLVNDDRNSQPDAPPASNSVSDNGGGELSRVTNNEENGNESPTSHLGSGSTDSEAYARRNQQRSDIEFYGHPGEETRQLKYGILGSGNYEVVNGGIYPEADESTAAVNSVANYVRKPGALLIAGLPKLMGNADHHHHQGAFMPGGRIGASVGGYMRDASAMPEDLVGHMLPGVEANKALASPLLDLIEANGGGHLFDPNLVAQLGSSGTSARTTHASQEADDDVGKKPGKRKHYESSNSLDGGGGGGDATTGKTNDDEPLDETKGAKSTSKKSGHGKAKKFKTSSDDHQRHHHHHHQAKLGGLAEFDDPNEQDTRSSSIDSNRQALDDDRNNEQDEISSNHHHHRHESKDDDYQSSSSSSGSRAQNQANKSQGLNQFNSYQILPSKKVTIFSDQDLDSAPSSMEAAYH